MLTFLSISTVVLLAVYFYLKATFYEQSWKKQGIKLYQKNKFLGPLFEYLIGDRALFKVLADIYEKHSNEPAVALGPFFQPSLFVVDPKNALAILQTDFHSFNHRGFEAFEGDVLSDNVGNQIGQKWKLVRQNMTPVFTGSKLKNMFYILDRSATDFIDYLNKDPEKLKGNAYNTLTTFCAAAIGASVFGITAESVFDNPFHKMAVKALEPSLINNLKFSIILSAPALSKLLKIKVFTKYERFFMGALQEVMDKRKKENVKRYDYVDLCLNLQQNETLKDRSTDFEVKPTLEMLAAQAFFFFIAGVEPSATGSFATLVELGRHPEQLKKVQEAIDETFEKHNGVLTYEIVNGIEILDRAMNEAFRMYPPIPFIVRQCVKDTVLPVGNIKVSKGTKFFIPVYEYHHDPKYYSDPKEFKPDRFDPNVDFMKDIYAPFGKGARSCIGNRFAQIQVKIGLIYLLRNFDIVTHIGDGGIKYQKNQMQVRLDNVDIEFVPRKVRH